MQAAISQADATVIASALALVGVIYAGWRANRTNRREHAANTDRLDRGNEKLDQLLENQDGIRREIHFIRSDVTDIHGAITELRRADSQTDARVTRLERIQPEGNDAA
jgi:peptidoglycan hydrolase CwlO-like protein